MVIAMNPISKDSKSGAKVSRFGADIVFSTTNHPDYNGVETVTYGEKEPFAITGPGDYEVKDVFVRGLISDAEISGKKYINTIYSFTIDGINICFLGALSNEKLLAEAREAIGNVDVLFVPIGGEGMVDAHIAYKVATSLEPGIIIPMDYGDDQKKDALKIFLKEGGEEKSDPQEKLTLKKKDLDGKDGDIVVLKFT